MRLTTLHVRAAVITTLTLLVLATSAACFLMSPIPKPALHDPKYCGSAAYTDFAVYLINLDRAADRLAWWTSQFEASDLADRVFTRVAAVEGKAIANLEELVEPRALEELRDLERTGHRKRHSQLSIGAVGCYMSHVKVWREAMERGNECAWVFEDDCKLGGGSGNNGGSKLYDAVKCTPLPEDWDIILLGVFCLKCSGVQKMPLRKVTRFFGTHGMIINRKAMAKLLEMPSTLPMSQQIDSYLSDLSEQGKLSVYALSADVVSQNQAFPTSIQVPLRPDRPGGEWESSAAA